MSAPRLVRSPTRRKSAQFWPLLAAALVQTALLATPGETHHAEKVALHLSPDGRDEGDCRSPDAPCRTIAYALARIGKGDTLRIAAGTYEFAPKDPFETLRLISDMVALETGFDATSRFRRLANAPTTIVGPLPVFEDMLGRRGLTLAQAPAQDAPETVARPAAPDPLTLFVAEDGTDDGDCTDPAAPCGTIPYALSQAPAGATIDITAGAFAMTRALYAEAEAQDITLRGSFLPNTAFASRAPSQALSFVIGPPPEARGTLAEQGLTLVQDPKYFDIVRGVADLSPSATPSPPARCEGGFAGAHPCRGLDLVAHVPLGELSSTPSSANDIWGFVDLDDDREYAIIGLRNGTAVVEVTDPSAPREVGTIPGLPTVWRDIKVLQVRDETAGRWDAYAYVTADAVDQGLQIIDLNGLPDSISLAATDEAFASAHNVYLANVDYASGRALPGAEPFAYILGSNLGTGSYRIFALDDPLVPSLVSTPPAAHGYTHDAASVLIDDARAADCAPGHDPCEVLIDYNETTVDLWDVTDKANPVQLSSLSYPNAHYTHSGWWSADKRFVFIQDELDEQDAGLNTTVHVVDITNLRAPLLAATWTGPTRAIDHNGFTVGDEYFISNYRRGLTVLDISRPDAPVEARHFDTFITPAEDSAEFNGAWGVFPFLPSGTILVSDIENGLFVLRRSATDRETSLDGTAFAWANDPTAESYVPSATYAHNPAGPIGITRRAVGRYAVRFAGFGSGDGTPGGTVQVTGWGSAASSCGVIGWSSGGADFVAHVQCHDGGAFVDDRFTVLVKHPRRT